MPATRHAPARHARAERQHPQARPPADRQTLLALSVRQPLASLLGCGWLACNTRWFDTDYRGLVAVHAAQAVTANEQELAAAPAVRRALKHLLGHAAGPEALPRGCLVAVARLAACDPVSHAVHDLTEQDCDLLPPIAGGYALRFADAVLLPHPVPCRGEAGLFAPPPDATARVFRQLAKQ